MASADVLAFIEAAECKQEAREIADKLLNFGSASPTDDEVLARSRMVFEYILHYALANIDGVDLDNYEIEVQTYRESE
ncbi:hypothetical protein LCGC14_1913210 [marine sediment metagenome]|uniref:Uncharacterized protein n=1 Tax=marine sediment metagenome TaxID=412755 RepID=A0A0F9FST1_9ZZZZ